MNETKEQGEDYYPNLKAAISDNFRKYLKINFKNRRNRNFRKGEEVVEFVTDWHLNQLKEWKPDVIELTARLEEKDREIERLKAENESLKPYDEDRDFYKSGFEHGYNSAMDHAEELTLASCKATLEKVFTKLKYGFDQAVSESDKIQSSDGLRDEKEIKLRNHSIGRGFELAKSMVKALEEFDKNLVVIVKPKE